jgi:hypothetical protein
MKIIESFNAIFLKIGVYKFIKSFVDLIAPEEMTCKKSKNSGSVGSDTLVYS